MRIFAVCIYQCDYDKEGEGANYLMPEPVLLNMFHVSYHVTGRHHSRSDATNGAEIYNLEEICLGQNLEDYFAGHPARGGRECDCVHDGDVDALC